MICPDCLNKLNNSSCDVCGYIDNGLGQGKDTVKPYFKISCKTDTIIKVFKWLKTKFLYGG